MTHLAQDRSSPDEKGRGDWTLPKPEVVPRPTFSPAAMAFGLTLSFWGLVTSPVILVVGLVVVVLALASWIGEIRNEA